MDCAGTPFDGQISSLEFQGRILNLNEPTPGKINVSFDDMAQRFRYQVTNHNLQKINFKTVLAAVKCTHPQIISASFSRSEDDQHILTVRVTYQFLPEIVEKLVFQKKEIPAGQSEQAMMRNIRTYIRGIREQINTLGSVQVQTGELEQGAETELFVRLIHKKTVFTWAITVQNLGNNIVKPQLYYYNSATKQRKATGAMPQEGVYVHYSAVGYIELKFLVDFQDFDMVIFQLQGKNKGEYTLSSERVEVMA